jgi:gluconate 2-dehydrogenase gamma chain
MLRRRDFLTTTAWFVVTSVAAHARVISGTLPWSPGAGDPPTPTRLGPWLHFTPSEAATVEALADRIIPPDPKTPGGRDAGCAVYLDRQLAGAYGQGEGLYNRPPFMKGSKQQGAQSEGGVTRTYRDGLAALDKYCRANNSGKSFAELDDAAKDELLKDLESEKIKLDGADGKAFFLQAVTDIQMGFFADPIYGGNRDMVSWKMIGFPGARYNYLDWVERHNEPYPLPPVSLAGRAEWTPRQ